MSTVTLGQLVRCSLRRCLGCDLAAGVGIAVARYAARLRCGRAPVPLAGFLPPLDRPEHGVRVELTLNPEDESVLAGEAASLGVPLGQLLVHAVLVYLAEVELLGIVPPPGEPCEAGQACW